MEVEVGRLAVEVAKGCRRLFVYINQLFTKETGKLKKGDQGLKDWRERQELVLAGTFHCHPLWGRTKLSSAIHCDALTSAWSESIILRLPLTTA
jgi:hypothetical protein